MKNLLACLLVVATSGCPSVETSPPVPAGPTVEFDPANNIVPFPNNLVLNPMTGKVNLPAQACESPTAMAIRTGVLNTLDGFGTFEAGIQVTLTAPADMASAQKAVVLYKRAANGMDLGTPQQVSILVTPAKTLRFDPNACSSPTQVDALNIVPLDLTTMLPIPLDEHSTYTVAVTSDLTDGTGTAFEPSFTWSLVRSTEDPVTLDDNGNVISERTPLDPTNPADLAQLQGLDLLWKAHAKALAALTAAGHDNSTILVAADFNTQTTSDPLDPSVAMSPAAKLSSTPLLNKTLAPGVFSVAVEDGAPCDPGNGCTAFFSALAGPGFCSALPCKAVGDVVGAALLETSYQVPGSNPLAGGSKIPGAWTDPANPMGQGNIVIGTVAIIPNGTPPAGGWPVVVFGHGLGSSKESGIAIAPQLAAAGFATVAIDFQAHGSRAVLTSIDPALGCAGKCSKTTTQACDGAMACPVGESCINGASVPISPTTTQQCYAPFLSSDLATTRDNIRQTVLDLQRLIKAVSACGPSNCPNADAANGGLPLSVDPAHIVYAGISLGGIIGSTTTSVAPELKASVLNVSGVGLVDILENTPNLQIRCTLVNSLIDAGILKGQKWDPANPTGALCLTDAWKDPNTQPGYAQFRTTARWVLDPADGANFTKKLAAKRFLLQEVVNDQVVPNIATDDEGGLTGLLPMTADKMTVPDAQMTPPPPSMAILSNPMTNKWVRYPTLPADAATMFPGNTFAHASLLQPTPGLDGTLGTLRLQVDAITYLVVNK